MRYIYLLIATILITGNFPKESTTNNKKCNIHVRIKKIKGPIHVKDLEHVDLLFTNKGNNPVFVPEFLDLGESFDDRQTDLIFNIKRKDTLFSKYKIVTQYVEFSLIEWDRKLITIYPNKKLKIEKGIQILDSLRRAGHYMLRAKVRLSNADGTTEIDSNWIRFRIIE